MHGAFFASFLVLYFVVRHVHYLGVARRAGRRPHTVIGGWASVKLWWAGYIALLGATLVTAVTSPPGLLLSVVALATLFSGTVLRVASFAELGQYYHPAVVIYSDHRIVRSGPYRVLRHPLHLGLLLEMLALCLLSSTWWATLLFALQIVVTLRRNAFEEAALESSLGGAYGEFRRTRIDVADVGTLITRRGRALLHQALSEVRA